MDIKQYTVAEGGYIDLSEPSQIIHAIPVSNAEHIGINYSCDKWPEYIPLRINFVNEDTELLGTTTFVETVLEEENRDPEYLLYCTHSNEYLATDNGGILVNGSGTYDIINNIDLGIDTITLSNVAKDSELLVTVSNKAQASQEVRIILDNNNWYLQFYAGVNDTWESWLNNKSQYYVYDGENIEEFWYGWSFTTIQQDGKNYIALLNRTIDQVAYIHYFGDGTKIDKSAIIDSNIYSILPVLIEPTEER